MNGGIFDAATVGTLTPLEGVQLALGIVLGVLALVLIFVAMFLFFTSEETGGEIPWQVMTPGLDILWFFIAPFANWSESPAARKCIYATVFCGTLAVILINW